METFLFQLSECMCIYNIYINTYIYKETCIYMYISVQIAVLNSLRINSIKFTYHFLLITMNELNP